MPTRAGFPVPDSDPPALPIKTSSRPRVAVVGAGITGLAAAVRLVDRIPSVTLTVFEAADRAGGVLQTVEREGFLVERSADNFLTKQPWATDFCKRLGLGEELIPTNEALRKALVLRRGKIVPAPEGFVLMAPRQFGAVIKTPLLSWLGKLRLACEPLVPGRRDTTDESVASFARRRLGKQVFERLVQPLLAGIYTADPEKLSMRATMPQFLEQEEEYGSLLRAAWREKSTAVTGESRAQGARYGLFWAPRKGMQQIVDAAAAALPTDSVRTGTAVVVAQPHEGAWRLMGADDQPLGDFDAVIVTTPAHHSAAILRSADTALATALEEIEYAGCSVVCLGYPKQFLKTPVPGFGFVVPAIERRQLIAVSVASHKFPGRAPGDTVLLRAFVGGALQPELAGLPDAELLKVVQAELRDLLGLSGEPLMTEIARWPRGMPQYHVGHLDRVDRIETLVNQHIGLELAGAALRGVGVPQCIASGQQAADRVARQLAGAQPRRQ